MNKTTNVILYCRVSSDEQKDNNSLNVQEEYLRNHCNYHGYNVVKVYREDYSAKHYDMKRPELKAIYEYCRKNKGEVDKVLFLRWDRYSRNVEFAFAYKRKFYDELGVEINAIESPIDFKGSEWSTNLAVYCGIAHTEDSKISRRTREGVRKSLKEGHWCNHAPKGYRHHRIGTYKDHNTHMVVDEKDAPLVRRIFEEVAKGVESADAIRKRMCPNMARTSYMQMLHNILYIGKIRVPALGEEPEQVIDGEHEPIVDEETFYRVQDLIEGRNRRKHTLVKGKKPHPDFYLRGHVVCPMCGRPITASFSHGNGGKYPYYHCMCSPRHYNVRAEKVNKEFVRYVSGLKPRKEVLKLYDEVLRSMREDGCVHQRKYLSELEEKLVVLEKRKKKLSVDYLDEKIDAKMYSELNQGIEDDIRHLKSQIEGVQTSIRTNLNPKLDYSISLIDNLDKYFEDAPIEVKQHLLSSIFPEKVEFDGISFRTTKYNSVLDLIYNETKQLRGTKKDTPLDVSVSVAGGGIEPPTSGL